MGVVIGRKGAAIKENEATDFIGGYVVALDLTARDFQTEAKKRGEPWSIAKGFDTSCPVGNFIPKETIPNPESLKIWAKVNGDIKQEGLLDSNIKYVFYLLCYFLGNTSDMIYNIPFLISFISQYFTLETGDLILTGTPEGVGPVKSGDLIEIGIGDISKASFTVA